jgi:hypothetical protein
MPEISGLKEKKTRIAQSNCPGGPDVRPGDINYR